ncbi:UTP5 U3 small nucleolar RNA-associated protein 5 [Candida maltosa Xu316]|uniref:Putative U3 snoRNP protein n=1 Tax=Candida maltosa (strain Xu316) TaxID=1245528 RepID=M3K1S1_CANMX|nr:putative U3 snoRNP protein [Candida maltosa Xu316]
MSGPVICSKFDSSGNYLATALVALDAHQIKVQSTNASQTSLNTSFTLDKSNRLTNLSWIPSTDNLQLLALCLTKGSILIYSPQTNEIVSELTTTNNVSVLDFHYSKHTRSGWSCDIEGNVYEWDLGSFTLLKSFHIGEYIESVDSINRVSTVMYNTQPHLLIGSNAVYLFNIKQKSIVKTFPGHIQPINSITPVGNSNDLFFTSAKGDRFINLYSLDKITTKSVFVASSSVLGVSVTVKDDQSVLVVINEEGNLEVFNNPLSASPSQTGSTPNKKKRKQVGVSSKTFNGSITLTRPKDEIKNPHDSNLFINAVSVISDSITFTWLENSTIPFFDTIKWTDETGTLLLDATNKIITKSKPNLKVTQHSTVNGHDVAAPKLYTEGHTIVSDGSNIKHLAEDDDEEDQDESLAEKLDKLSMDNKSGQQKSRRKKLEEARSGVSLSIILSQSLKNNDQALLETVLSNRDTVTIQNTISRLDPYSSVMFLDKLSEKIQRQPNRFEQFSFWLKWILVIHGPVIASLPNLNVKLSNLHAVLLKKAEALPRLLELQGRLNLLNDNTDLKNEIFVEDDVEDEYVEEGSDVEYIEELDDAQYIGVISDDDEDEIMDGVDDYEESEDDEDDDDEDVDIPSAAELVTDSDNE